MKYIILFFKWVYLCKITDKHQYKQMGRKPAEGGKVTKYYRCVVCGKWIRIRKSIKEDK